MENNNEYVCDLETGFCGIQTHAEKVPNFNALPKPQDKPLHIIYFSDPICSYCWNIEGFLKRLSLEYGDYFTIEERMGGLLRQFGEVDYEGQEINAKKMAEAWDLTSEKLRIPINGSVWLTDPLSSSFPASIAFKAAELQSEKLAIDLLRKLRESLFVEAKNISKWEVIEADAKLVGLNVAKLKEDYESGKAEALFNEDIALGQEVNVDVFPTLFIVDKNDNHIQLVAPISYVALKSDFKKILPEAKLTPYNKDVLSLMQRFGSTTLKEMSVLTERSYSEVEVELVELTRAGKLVQIASPKGSLWRLKV